MGLEIYFTAAGLVVGAVAAVVAYMQLRRTPKSHERPDPPARASTTKFEPPAVGPLEQIDHNLPSRVPLVGRGKEIARAFDGLAGPLTVVSVEGLGGMGKTAIAREVAWRVVDPAYEARHTPTFETVVWVTDQGGRLKLNDILDTVAWVVELPYIKALPPDEKYLRVVRHLADVTCLLVVDGYDGASSAEIDRFLQDVPPSCRVILTTRRRYAGEAWVVTVDELDRSAAFELLRQEGRRLEAPEAAEMTEATFEPLYRATGGNPLALRLAAGQLRYGLSPADDVTALLQGPVGERIFHTIFHRTWHELLADDDYSRRLLMVMALHAGPVVREALEAGADVHGASLTAAVSRLIDLSMLDRCEQRGVDLVAFEIHPLTAGFVHRVLDVQPQLRAELERRLVRHYQGLVRRHAQIYQGVEHIRALEHERANILAFADRCYQAMKRTGDRDTRNDVVFFARELAPFLWGRGYWQDQLTLSERALEAARRSGDHEAAVVQHTLMGRIHVWRDELDRAWAHVEAAERELDQVDSDAATARVLRLRAQLVSRERPEEAEKLLDQILETAPDDPSDSGRAATLIELGVAAEAKGDVKLARERYIEALRLDEASGSHEGRAVSLSHLGDAELALGNHGDARRYYDEGLTLARRVHRLGTLGRCQYGLARVLRHEGRLPEAAEQAEGAVKSFRQLGMHDLEHAARLLHREAESGLDGLQQ